MEAPLHTIQHSSIPSQPRKKSRRITTRKKRMSPYLQTLWFWKSFWRAFGKASRVSSDIAPLRLRGALLLLVVVLSQLTCFSGLGTTSGFPVVAVVWGPLFIDLRKGSAFSMAFQPSSCFWTILTWLLKNEWSVFSLNFQSLKAGLSTPNKFKKCFTLSRRDFGTFIWEELTTGFLLNKKRTKSLAQRPLPSCGIRNKLFGTQRPCTNWAYCWRASRNSSAS